jgi:hypothetical protein
VLKVNYTPKATIPTRRTKLPHEVYARDSRGWYRVAAFISEREAQRYAEQLVWEGIPFVASVHPKEWYSYRKGTRAVTGTTIRKDVVKKHCWGTKFPKV